MRARSIWGIFISAALVFGGEFSSARAGENNTPGLYGAALGEACVLPADCTSGFCVDGVCCDNECGGNHTDDCQVCAKSLSASADGVCTLLAAGTVCRESAGVCDIFETCDGLAPECPINILALAGTVCRASASECDAIEACDGILLDCPADMPLMDGAPCEGGLCQSGLCEQPPVQGSGGSGGAGGSGAFDEETDEGSCGCRVPGGSGSAHLNRMVYIFFGIFTAGMLRVRTRRR